MAVVLAVDAGTTGVRSLAVDESGRVVASRYQEFPQYFPRPGWVEHDAEEIWQAVAGTLADLVAGLRLPVAAVGLAVQRETTVVWDRREDRPLHRAIVWQDRRTAGACERLEQEGHLAMIRARTGLVLDPYFSATKLAWLLGEGGVTAGPDTAFGTIDSWLIWRLSGGRAHVTDPSNASRTMLFDIARRAWDDELTGLFGVPASMLPQLGPSSGRLARTADGVVPGLAGGIPVSGVAGDQQAALFGQACFEPGMTKNTYGTGSFVLMNVGREPPPPTDGLLTSVAWSLGDLSADHTAYALEGAVFVTGAAVQWLRDGLGLISESAQIGPLAASVADTGGAYFVPALTGLGSPWWDPHARGTMVGLTRGVGRAQLARAVVEAMAFQTADVVVTMGRASGHGISELRIDGGASVMDLLLQLQADVTGIPVRRAAVTETTALGAAFLAGLAEGVWGSLDDLAGLWTDSAVAVPAADRTAVTTAYEGWSRAVARARHWA
ncbi:MAG: glycerol kinase [Actinomycetota bacterium]|nr:glycerol kinase [Actinomycetota bacterium]